MRGRAKSLVLHSSPLGSPIGIRPAASTTPFGFISYNMATFKEYVKKEVEKKVSRESKPAEVSMPSLQPHKNVAMYLADRRSWRIGRISYFGRRKVNGKVEGLGPAGDCE